MGPSSSKSTKPLSDLSSIQASKLVIVLAGHIGQQPIDGVARNAVVDEDVGIARQAAARDAVGAHLRCAVEQARGLDPAAMAIRDQVARLGARALAQQVGHLRCGAVGLTLVDEGRRPVEMGGAGRVVHHRYAIGVGCHTAVGLRVEPAGPAADQELERLWVVLELREKVVGQVELDGSKPLRRADSVQAKLGGRELLVHIGDRDQIRAAAARVEIKAVVEELAEGHQEQVGAVRVRRADRVPVRVERLLADHVADQPWIRQRRRAIGGGRADRVGARLRVRLRLELSRRQVQEWLVSVSPERAAWCQVVGEAADVPGVETRVAHLRQNEIQVFRAELDRAL